MTDHLKLADEAAASLVDDGYSANLVERLEQAVRQLVSDRADLKAALVAALEKATQVMRERDEARAEVGRLKREQLRDCKTFHDLEKERDRLKALVEELTK